MREVFWFFVVFLGVFLSFSSCYQVKPDNYTEIIEEDSEYYTNFEREFYTEYSYFRSTGVRSPSLQNMIMGLFLPTEAQLEETDDVSLPVQKIKCSACRAIVTVFLGKYHILKQNKDKLAYEAFYLCTVLNIQTEEVCHGAVYNNIDIIDYILKNRPYLTPRTICGILYQSASCMIMNPKFSDWKIEVDQNGPPITKSKVALPSKGKDLKIIHLTDFHYDPQYVVGMRADCNAPLCCRKSNGPAMEGEPAAGKWGHYNRCDVPLETIVDSIQQVKKAHPDADYIYYTGDIVDHGVWNTSQPYNRKSMEAIYGLLKDNFISIPLFPLIGNHEAHPVNIFAPTYLKESEITTNWLYDYSADEWKTWLPANTDKTIRTGGYYTALVHPGFRIVALNNNECYTFNWWILFDPKHLTKQLQWFHDVMLEAERSGEKVHLLQHIPSGKGECYKTWAREYRKVIDRFHNTIMAVFMGHTHRDEFNVYYSREDHTKAINVGFNGGSIVTYSNVNPNYVVYHVDSETYQVNDFESWYYNLTEANLSNKSPKWTQMYSFKRDFDLPDLSPASMDQLITRMATDKSLLKKYWEFKVKRGDPFLAQGCDDKCLLNHLCTIVTTEFGDDKKCQELTRKFYNRLV